MRYVAGSTKETGCIFCNRFHRSEDVESLILHRGDHSFVIMNLYPYNTGHIMLVPNQHAADLEELQRKTLHEMGELLPVLTRALRRAFGCDGFNIGLNLGAIAGAGVAAHLHQHIVPRWQGDANFMPILARTMTIPELIPVTYAKIRAELEREVAGVAHVSIVLFPEDPSSVLLHRGRIPTLSLQPNTPVMESIRNALPGSISEFALAGWAGEASTASASRGLVALTLLGTPTEVLPEGWETIPVEELDPGSDTKAVIDRALGNLAPAT